MCRPNAARPGGVCHRLGVGIIGLLVLLDASHIGGGAYARIGPATFPTLIGFALLGLSGWTMVEAWRGDFPERAHDEFAPIVWIVGGLAAQLLLLTTAGFSIATGLLFAATARAFGKRKLYVSIPVGILIEPRDLADVHEGPEPRAAGRTAGTPLRLSPIASGPAPKASPFQRAPPAGTARARSNHGLPAMDTFALLGQGLATAAQPMNLLYALIGVTLGTAVGVLPGIGPALTVALLLPVTYQLDAAGSLIMFAGIYYGGMYGGSTTSILLNTPGESASIITALEGNKMARKGRGGPALATAAIGSFVAGLIATLGLAFLAPVIVSFALSFGPAEYFALMLLAFVTVSAAFGDSALRGLTALVLGLTLGLVGIDLQTGQARLTLTPIAQYFQGMAADPAASMHGLWASLASFFGGISANLLDGIEVTTLAVALFAIGECLVVAAAANRTPDTIQAVKGSLWMTKEDWKRSWKPWLRGTAVGFRSARCRPAAPRSAPSSPIRWRRTSRNTRKSSATARSRASRVPRPPTTRRPPERSCRS